MTLLDVKPIVSILLMTIYYIDGQRKGIQGGHDMGVYKMEGGRVEPLPGFVSDTNRKDPNWWWPNQLCITCKSWQWFYPSTYIYIYISRDWDVLSTQV